MRRDIADNGEAPAIIDAFLGDRAGEPAGEAEEIRRQPLDRNDDQLRVGAERLADQIGAVALAGDRLSIRRADQRARSGDRFEGKPVN